MGQTDEQEDLSSRGQLGERGRGPIHFFFSSVSVGRGPSLVWNPGFAAAR